MQIITKVTNLVTSNIEEITHTIPDDIFKELDFLDILEKLELPKSYYMFFVNGDEVSTDDLQCFIEDNDIFGIVEVPQFTAIFGLTGFWAAIGNIATSMLLSWVANELFAPDIGDQTDYTQSAAYNLNDSQNTTAIGEYVGVGYGVFRIFPKLCAQPFVFYKNDDMYVSQQFAIGQGEYAIQDIFLGSTSVLHDDNVVMYNYNASAGYNHTATVTAGHMEPMWTTESVNRLDNVSSDPVIFETSGSAGYQPPDNGGVTPPPVPAKPAQTMPLWKVNPKASLSINLSAAAGIWWSDSKGKKHDMGVLVELMLYNASKVLVKTVQVEVLSASYRGGEVQDSVRVTFTTPKGYSFIKVRIKNKASKEDQQDINVDSIYEMFPSTTASLGNVKLVNIQMKASGTVSGSNKVQLKVQRTDATKYSSLKDIVTDIYSDTAYGAKLPKTDLLFDSITAHTKVDCYFDRQRTVLDSMRELLKPQMFHIVPTGSQLHIKQDKAQTIPVQAYDQTRTNNLKLTYNFKERVKDSVEVEYRDSEWKSQSTRHPKTGIDPQIVPTKGLADDAQAERYAKYLYKNDKRNKFISFDTDIQGRIPSFLDIISVDDPILKDKIWVVTKATRDSDTTKIEALLYDASIYS